MFKSGFFLSVSNLAIALFGLARNILIARLISIEDFGIAATFAITMALVEMTSYIGIDRLLVQASDGDRPGLQATAQLLQVMRGVAGAIVLLLIAEPLAGFFRVPQATWAYQLFSLAPLMRGFAHLDMFRFQREMRFGPSVAVELVAILTSTFAAVPLGLWLNDYSVMLYVILLHQTLFMAISHHIAERSYHWDWNSAVLRQVLSFGWPLLLNGLLMFCIFQGDRIIVGGLIGMTELGWFSAAFSLTLAPTLVMAKTLNTFFLPQLSKLQDTENEFRHLYLVTVQSALVSGVAIGMFFAVAGPAFMLLLYGVDYEPAFQIIVWLAVMQGVRLAKAGPAIVSTAKAETTIPMIANLVRILVLPVAWVAVEFGAGVAAVIKLAIVGEALAVATSIYLLHSWLGLSARRLTLPIAIFSVSLGLAVLENFLFYREPLELRLGQFLLAVTFVLMLGSMPEMRRWLRDLIRLQ